jgi:hypothetical protein
MEVCGQQPDRFRGRRSGSHSFGDQFAADVPCLQWNLGADIALRKEHIKQRPQK